MKQWNTYFRQALTPEAMKAQFKPGSALSQLFLFSFVAAITLGVIYNFVGRNLVGTRASTDTLTATTSVSKSQVGLNEEFTLNILLAAPAGKKISQLDLRVNLPVSTTTGDIAYTAGKYQSAAVGGTQTYFDTVVLESLSGAGANKKYRLVLSSRKKEIELSDKVLVKVAFKGVKNGNVTFILDGSNMEIVGPGGATTEPVSYTIGTGSVTSATVTIGGPLPSLTLGPGCRYVERQCIDPPCTPLLVCPSATAGPSPTKGATTPTPTGKVPTSILTPTKVPTKAPTQIPTKIPTPVSSTIAGSVSVSPTTVCVNRAVSLGGAAQPNGTLSKTELLVAQNNGQSFTGCPVALFDDTFGHKFCMVSTAISANPTTTWTPRQAGTYTAVINVYNTAGQKCSGNPFVSTWPVLGYSFCGTNSRKTFTVLPATHTSCIAPSATPTKAAAPTPTKTPTKIPTAGPSPTKVPSATPTRTPTPSPRPGTPTVTPAPTAGGTVSVTIRLKFNGIGANLAPVKDTQKVKVTLAHKNLNAPVSKIVDFKISGQSAQNIRIFEGKADFTNIPVGGDYSVFIKGAQQIQKRVCANRPTETADGRYICTDGNITLVAGTNTLDFSNIYQLGGDLPVSNQQSGFVDSVDITFVRSNLGSKAANVLAVADLNFDGIVDTQDYAISLYSLSFKYDEEAVGNQ